MTAVHRDLPLDRARPLAWWGSSSTSSGSEGGRVSLSPGWQGPQQVCAGRVVGGAGGLRDEEDWVGSPFDCRWAVVDGSGAQLGLGEGLEGFEVAGAGPVPGAWKASRSRADTMVRRALLIQLMACAAVRRTKASPVRA